MLLNFRNPTCDLRRALLAACVTAGFAATPAAAYDSFFPYLSAPPAGPAAKVQADQPVNPAAKRRSRHKEMTRKLSSEKRVAERLPAGPLQIVISIKKQQLTLYAGGHPVAHSRVSTGVPGHPTPQGVFCVLEKQIYHESNIYSAAPMPFMQRITWSGVAMHQGVVPNYPASHGCIRMPADFARRLWGMTKVGARVIIAQDDVALSEISNKRLFTALPQVTAEAEPPRVRVAANATTDAPLSGAAASAESEEARIERAIDGMVQAGRAETDAAVRRLTRRRACSTSPPRSRPRRTRCCGAGPISVYISRKLGKLFVRKGFAEVFDAPVIIARPDAAAGHARVHRA